MLFKTLVLNIFLVIYVPSAIAADDIESFGSIWKFSSEIKTYQEHQGLAQAWGGNLASIKNDQESSFVKSKVVGISSWFGASRLIGQANSEISWKWNDGSSWVYTDWLVGEPNDGQGVGNENCVRIKNKSGWSDIHCSLLSGAVYKKSSVVASSDDIESFGSIWKFSSEIKTYQEHQGLAQAWGGNLASIKNDQESSFVKSKVVGISSWFGASRLIGQANSEISWKWDDGSSWVYTDWLVGQPNDSGPNDNGGNENCVRIKNKSGWSDMSCSHLAGAVYKKSSPTTSAPTTSSPTTAFQAFNNQDFSIVEPALLFFDNQGQFSVQLNYTVGLTASDLNITVMNENCSEIDDSMPDTIKIGHQFVRNHVFSKQVLIFKETFGTSPLVSEKNQATGASSGTLRFCVLVETLTEDGVPVSFRKTNVQLTYDLTSNIFEVEGNGISENAIDTSTKEVTTKYGILACRCTKESFDCDTTKPLPLLEQNGFSFICIKTDSNSSSVKISNFDMRFEQDNETKYTAVTFGNSEPTVDDLSQVQKDGDSLKIVSRLVTVLFEKTSFDVKGNAYLVFKDATRRLVTAPVQGLRSAQETTQGDSAGNVEFSMDVTLKKATGNKVTKSANYAGIAVLTVGGFAVVAILFLGIKKTNK